MHVWYGALARANAASGSSILVKCLNRARLLEARRSGPVIWPIIDAAIWGQGVEKSRNTDQRTVNAANLAVGQAWARGAWLPRPVPLRHSVAGGAFPAPSCRRYGPRRAIERNPASARSAAACRRNGSP